jgi:ubiquinone/menaquinone biosynthesis C-methylase UbiE
MTTGDSAAAAEFDAYAAGYAAGMEDPLKRLAGGGFDAFIDLKVRWLLRDLARRPLRCAPPAAGPALLDFGCGTGDLLQSLRRHGFGGALHGCDLSAGMLAEAARRWRLGPPPALTHVGPGDLPFAPASVDLVTVCCVLHHVPPAEHPALLARLARVLRPGGRLVVFEHNPHNPLTRRIVRNAPIDRNAILVTAAQVRAAASAAALAELRTRYILFFPPRFPRLGRAERLLGWLPLGGQYVVAAEKPTGAGGR